jgi:YbbR domain-containing protein
MRGRWTTNLLLKALALLLALFLWNLYRTEAQAVRSLTVPIQFENLPKDREMAGDVPAAITVEVEAPEPLARTLSPEWIDAIVDLHSAEIGEREFALGPDVVRLPAGARLLSVSPASVTLRIEATATKQVPIEARVRGSVKDGFQVGHISVQPVFATLEGPSSEVAQATRALTEPVVVNGRDATFQAGVALVIESGHLRLLTPRTAIATIEVLPASGETPAPTP